MTDAPTDPRMAPSIPPGGARSDGTTQHPGVPHAVSSSSCGPAGVHAKIGAASCQRLLK